MGNLNAVWTVSAAGGQPVRKYPTEIGADQQQQPNNIIETVPGREQRLVVGRSEAINMQVWFKVISHARREAGWIRADAAMGALDGDPGAVAPVTTFTITAPGGVQVRRDHSPSAALMGPIVEPAGRSFEVREIFRPADGAAWWLNIESPRYGDAWVCLGTAAEANGILLGAG